MTVPRVQRGLDAAKSDADLARIAALRQRAKAVGLPLSASIEEIEFAESANSHYSRNGGSDSSLNREARKQEPTVSVREKQVEHAGDKLMLTYGFRVIRFSQARASKQTDGIPDRKYFHRARRLAVWWEAKSPTGKQRNAQREFQLDCDAAGEAYVLGGVESLRRWLTAKLESVR